LYLDADHALTHRIAQRLFVYAAALNNPRLRRRALSLAGVCALDAGNVRAGIALVAEAIELARALGDIEGELATMTNLGLAFNVAFDFDASIQCSLSVAEHATHLASPDDSIRRALAFCNASDAALHQGDANRALLFARQALESAGPNLTLLAVQASRANMARALWQLDRRSEAVESARQGLAWNGDESLRAQLPSQICRVIIALSSPDPEAGFAMLTESLALGKRVAHAEHVDSLAFCVEIFDKADRPDEALMYLRELHELQRQHQVARMDRMVGPFDTEVRSATSAAQQLARAEEALAQRVTRKEAALVDMALESAAASGYSVRRPFRVARLAELFAEHLGLAVETVAQVREAAFFMDVGMATVSTALLLKRRLLNAAERSLVMQHVQHGARLVQDAGLSRHRAAVDLIRLHHERWDGGGPLALAGAEVPLPARVVALADVYDALVSARPWRSAMSAPQAVRSIEAEAGRRFDPQLTARFAEFVRLAYWAQDDFQRYLEEQGAASPAVRAREDVLRLVGTAR